MSCPDLEPRRQRYVVATDSPDVGRRCAYRRRLDVDAVSRQRSLADCMLTSGQAVELRTDLAHIAGPHDRCLITRIDARRAVILLGADADNAISPVVVV